MAETVRSYKDLRVWQKAVAQATTVYTLSAKFPKEESYGLRRQLRNAAVSVASNIAEGHARQYDNEFKQFLHISLGSLAELDTQFCIAQNLDYVAVEDICRIQEDLIEVRKMICGLLSRLSNQTVGN